MFKGFYLFKMKFINTLIEIKFITEIFVFFNTLKIN